MASNMVLTPVLELQSAMASEMKAGTNAITSVIAGSTLCRPPRPIPRMRLAVKTPSVNIAAAGRLRTPSYAR